MNLVPQSAQSVPHLQLAKELPLHHDVNQEVLLPSSSSHLPLFASVHESSHLYLSGGDGGGALGEFMMFLAPQSAQSVPYEHSV